MQNEFYQNMPGTPIFYGNTEVPNQSSLPPTQEQYMESVLKKTEPVKAKVYMTFPDSTEWRDRVFEGILEASGRDYLIIHEIQSGNFILIPLIYVDYIEFQENIQKYL